ncbi:MAG: ribose 5-phosphate isomerase A [Gemmatimonadales bacterium]
MSGVEHDVTALKRDAAERAVEFVRPGMVVGLGTGSTTRFAIEALGRKLESRELTDVVGIPTSTETRDLARRLGLTLSTLEQHPVIDLTIDGADEVDPAGNLIKGGGGALLWEKIVATASRKLVIVVDEGKLVERLGKTFALPVEVVAFGWNTHEGALRELGAQPVLRCDPSGAAFRTDEGHYILDCRFPEGIVDPAMVSRTLVERPGVVETGLFFGMEPEVIVGRSLEE